MRKHEIFDDHRETKIRIKIKVPDMNREFNFKLLKKTRIKEICIRLCDLLDLDPLRTDIFMFPPGGFLEMNHSSTLFQNGIDESMILTAKIHYTGYRSKVNTLYKIVSKKTEFGNATAENFIDSDKFPVYSLRTQVELYGVKVTGTCVNPRCIAYDKEVSFLLGTGTFDINNILTNTRCQTCPYKDRNSQKPIKVKNISLVNCYWKVEGNYIDVNGFNNFKYCKDWFKTEGADNLKLYDMLQKTNYINPALVVKCL